MDRLRAKQVSSFVFSRARQLGPTGIRALVVHLRSLLRFLEFSGRLRPGLSRSVPPLPPPPPSTLETKAMAKVPGQFCPHHSNGTTRLRHRPVLGPVGFAEPGSRQPDTGRSGLAGNDCALASDQAAKRAAFTLT